MTRYVALLRGINVGGRNLIKMPALKACFEANDFQNVSTYVLFESAGSTSVQLIRRIEEMLAETFDYVPTVVVRNRKQMRAIVQRAEEVRDRAEEVPVRRLLPEGAAHGDCGDEAPANESGRRQSACRNRNPLRLEAHREGDAGPAQRIISSPIYPSVTISNWNTTTKLLALMGWAASRAVTPEDAASTSRTP